MRPHRLLVAAAALSALAHLVGRWYDQPLLPAAQALAWCALAGAALTAPELPPRPRYGLAVAALPRRAPDRRRTAAAVVLAVLAGLLAVVRDSAFFLPPYALPPDPGDVLPAYLVLVGLALVALVRSGSVPVALGLGLAAVVALGVLPPTLAPASGPGLVFYSAEEYRVRVTGGGVWADLSAFLAAALVLAGFRWADLPRRRAHGAARPGS